MISALDYLLLRPLSDGLGLGLCKRKLRGVPSTGFTFPEPHQWRGLERFHYGLGFESYSVPPDRG